MTEQPAAHPDPSADRGGERRDAVDKVTSTLAAAETNRQLAEAEKKAAGRMTLGPYLWWLVAALVLYAVYLVVPHAGDVRGFEVTFRLPAAVDSGIKITEYVFAWLMLGGLGVFTTLTVLTRRTVFGLIAWMFVTVGVFYSLFAMWLRMTRSSADDGVNVGVGMAVAVVAVFIAEIAYAIVALRRSPEQARIAEERARHANLDEVGYAQREARTGGEAAAQPNPLLADDRRQRAARRHGTTGD
ncbi:Rv2732c family membrane protein [Corynebacterium guangdongense]|uniref:Uncharacterized protein n=1 Tax=Corynebacterium guangdongense TaxID=1783348 RepID=A0ABU2A052_9CORY|nr:hypothetical protein [Corynebacterium guangdongense]MDR7329523.1 hypothetical protein [Corynebacterium guangdongense]WJZ18088.1 hypothetical protein CGUA_07630 [Corynebacterium guangdongense]